MISLTSKVLILIFLFSSMFAIGLQTDFKDFSLLLQKKLLLLKSIIANFIVVPLVGILIIKIFSFSQTVSLAFIILALTPGGLSAIQFGSKIKGESAYAGFTVLLLSLLAIFISPVLMTFFIPKSVVLAIPYLELFVFLLVFMLLPIVLGVLIHHKIALIANKLSKLFSLLGTLAFVLMIVLTLAVRKVSISAHALEIIIVMLFFIFIMMLIGWLMGGPERKTRQVLAIITSMRNVALCLVVAMETAPQAKVITPLVALGALMVFPNMLFTLFSIIRDKFLKKKTSVV